MGVQSIKTKWQCGLGSSKDLRKAFSAASFMASAGAIIKKSVLRFLCYLESDKLTNLLNGNYRSLFVFGGSKR